MARSATLASSLPWWATAGNQSCPVCLQRYHYELEYRCADCDQPLCPHCAVRVSVEVAELHCPDCGALPPLQSPEES